MLAAGQRASVSSQFLSSYDPGIDACSGNGGSGNVRKYMCSCSHVCVCFVAALLQVDSSVSWWLVVLSILFYYAYNLT